MFTENARAKMSRNKGAYQVVIEGRTGAGLVLKKIFYLPSKPLNWPGFVSSLTPNQKKRLATFTKRVGGNPTLVS